MRKELVVTEVLCASQVSWMVGTSGVEWSSLNGDKSILKSSTLAYLILLASCGEYQRRTEVHFRDKANCIVGSFGIDWL